MSDEVRDGMAVRMDSVGALRERLRTVGFGVSSTSGRSMRPLIWGGVHSVVVVPLEAPPAVGDLLMFTYRGDGRERNIVHRLVKVSGVSDKGLSKGDEKVIYVMQGDNCIGCEYVKGDDIIGRVTEIVRTGGWRPWYVLPGRSFRADGFAARAYARLWRVTRPLRHIAYRLRGHLHGFAARLRRP